VPHKSFDSARLDNPEQQIKGKERIHQSKFIHFSIQPFRRADHEHIPGNSYSAIPFSYQTAPAPPHLAKAGEKIPTVQQSLLDTHSSSSTVVVGNKLK
jgi:hypothetical protein